MNRLNLGCGLQVAEGWVNIDRDDHGQGATRVFDFRSHLPFETASFDAVVAHHVLDMLTLDELARVLGEVHRVLVPGGVLRISTPDVEEAIRVVVQQSEAEALEWFPMVERGVTALEKLSHWLTWYGTRRTLLCFEMLEPMLREAGFTQVAYAICGETVYGLRADVCELDVREFESIFVEALT